MDARYVLLRRASLWKLCSDAADATPGDIRTATDTPMATSNLRTVDLSIDQNDRFRCVRVVSGERGSTAMGPGEPIRQESDLAPIGAHLTGPTTRRGLRSQ
ncbi:hypothetical protein KRMM14A1004_05160 [Krasilnikovia sp. MM14-A1004]